MDAAPVIRLSNWGGSGDKHTLIRADQKAYSYRGTFFL